VLEFGHFRLDPDRQILWREGQLVPIGPKVVQTLAILAARSGQVVAKDDLIRQVWGDIAVEENSLAHNIFVLRKILKEDSSGAFTIETIPRRGYRFCEIPQALTANGTPPERSSPNLAVAGTDHLAPTRARRHWLWPVLVFGALLSLAVTTAYLAGYRPLAKGRGRRSVAVMGFVNRSENPGDAWLSPGLSEMLLAELATGERFRPIPADDVARTKIDLSLPDKDAFDKTTLLKLHRNLGSDLVVTGAYIVLEQNAKKKIRLDARVQDATTGETVASVVESGDEGDLFDLVSHAGARLRETLGQGEVSPSAAASLRASAPSNSAAARLYAEGLAALRRNDAIAARDSLTRAVEADPKFPLSRIALAQSWSALGYDGRAQERAKQAFDLSSSLTQEQRLSVEAQYREISNEWKLAADIYRRLWDFYPDDPEYGLQLARTQVSGSEGKDALVTVAKLRSSSPAASADIRIDLAEASADESIGDFKAELAVASRAKANAVSQGMTTEFAEALQRYGLASLRLGNLSVAIASYVDAERAYDATNDKSGKARVLSQLGEIKEEQGDLASAETMEKQASALFREIGDWRHLGGVLLFLVNVELPRGDFASSAKCVAEAEALYHETDNKRGLAGAHLVHGLLFDYQQDHSGAKRETEIALSLFRQTGQKHEQALALNNIANYMYEEGDLRGAKNLLDEALAIIGESGDKKYRTYVLVSLAQVLLPMGSLSEAKQVLNETLSLSVELGSKTQVGWARFVLANVEMVEGNLAAARKDAEESLRLRKESEDRANAADSLVTLGELSIEEGHPDKAEPLLGQAIAELEKEKQTDDLIWARSILARALLLEGNVAGAEKEVEEASRMARKSRNSDVLLRLHIMEGRLLEAKKKYREAVLLLRSTLAEATKRNYVNYQLEGSLALAEVEIEEGRTAEGRNRLMALEKSAVAKGFALIAQKAAQDQKPVQVAAGRNP